MLGKLILFDLKASSRVLEPLHAALLLCTLAGRLFLAANLEETVPSLFLGLIFLFYFLLLFATVAITALFFIYWFYKNLFTDEGYLMHTLPAPAWMHIASKTIGMVIWHIIDTIVVGACMLILLFAFSPFADAFPALLRYVSAYLAYALDLQEWGMIALSVLLFLLSIVVHGMSAFLCIAVGQLFNRHRVLAAFIAYIVLSVIVSFASAFFLLAVAYDTMATDVYVTSSYLSELVSSLVLSILYFAGTNYLVSRKLNLE